MTTAWNLTTRHCPERSVWVVHIVDECLFSIMSNLPTQSSTHKLICVNEKCKVSIYIWGVKEALNLFGSGLLSPPNVLAQFYDIFFLTLFLDVMLVLLKTARHSECWNKVGGVERGPVSNLCRRRGRPVSRCRLQCGALMVTLSRFGSTLSSSLHPFLRIIWDQWRVYLVDGVGGHPVRQQVTT